MIAFMKIHSKARIEKQPWNKGKSVGQKRPFPADAVPIIRHFLKDDLRDLALFNVGIDTMLRGSDLLTLRFDDVVDGNGAIVEEGITRQTKTKAGIEFILKSDSRASLAALIAGAGKQPGDYLFVSARKNMNGKPLSSSQYRRLVKKWAAYAGLDPKRFSGHSTRRTKSSVIYEKTQNLAACQHLLGHKSVASTALYLGVDKRKALDLAKDTDV